MRLRQGIRIDKSARVHELEQNITARRKTNEKIQRHDSATCTRQHTRELLVSINLLPHEHRCRPNEEEAAHATLRKRPRERKTKQAGAHVANEKKVHSGTEIGKEIKNNNNWPRLTVRHAKKTKKTTFLFFASYELVY